VTDKYLISSEVVGYPAEHPDVWDLNIRVYEVATPGCRRPQDVSINARRYKRRTKKKVSLQKSYYFATDLDY